jgi:CheY-like chemotaxis protein
VGIGGRVTHLPYRTSANKRTHLEDTTSSGAQSPGERPARPLRVLLVEDYTDSATSMAMLIRLYGHEVEVVGDGPAALDAARAAVPDVVLLDIGLPKMSGHEVARRLTASGGKKPFLIALTGYGGPDEVKRCMEAGFDLHLLKPADPEQLRLLLQERQQLLHAD